MAEKRDLSDPVTLRIPRHILADIERIAAITERSRSWIIVRALRGYLATEGADILAIEEGRRQIAAGDAHAIEDVLRELSEPESKSAA